MNRDGEIRWGSMDIGGPTMMMLIIGLSSVMSSDIIVDPELPIFMMPAAFLFPSEIPENDTRCYGDLGCLTIDKDLINQTDMISNIFPMDREVINTTFSLYTSLKQIEGEMLNVTDNRTIVNSGFDPQRPTKFIVHGYISSSNETWVKLMKTELLKHGNYNVILVNWEGGSFTMYPQAAANTRLVGMEIAYLIDHLKKYYGLNDKDVHVIGHSLGAHASGYAGYTLGGSIARITGLDPAKPYFQGIPVKYRLDHTDAKFVDVIHTETRSINIPGFEVSFGMGLSEPCGHVDFYPNGGHSQPGCGDDKPIDAEGLFSVNTWKRLSCSHGRSARFFIESINSKCRFYAHECNDWVGFRRGECSSCNGTSGRGCGVMGYQADTSPALVELAANGHNASAIRNMTFFLSTSDESSYCV